MSSQVAVVERGCWPLPLPEHYAWDAEHLKEYVALAATDEGFAKYLDKYVYERRPDGPQSISPASEARRWHSDVQPSPTSPQGGR